MMHYRNGYLMDMHCYETTKNHDYNRMTPRRTSSSVC